MYLLSSLANTLIEKHLFLALSLKEATCHLSIANGLCLISTDWNARTFSGPFVGVSPKIETHVYRSWPAVDNTNGQRYKQ